MDVKKLLRAKVPLYYGADGELLCPGVPDKSAEEENKFKPIPKRFFSKVVRCQFGDVIYDPGLDEEVGVGGGRNTLKFDADAIPGTAAYTRLRGLEREPAEQVSASNSCFLRN